MAEAVPERAELEQALLRVLAERYHDHHPFNRRMHEGTLSPEEIRLWVRNRYYYQTRIPIKDGAILSKSTSAEFRREWVERLHDHDGTRDREGGLELWLRLGEAVGLPRESVESLEEILPGVRAACDAYVEFVKSHDLLESVAASLTEMAAGEIMKVRIEAFERHYPWVEGAGLDYFRSRTVQAPRDARYGMAFVLEHARSESDRARCIAALERKCDILWSLLDAVELGGARLRLAPHAQLREEEPDKTLVVLPERAVRLGGSGREILDLCDGRTASVEIARTLVGRHPEVESIWDDVHHFFEQMDRLGVLVREGP
ncbi:MAG: pyrroloquinoline-quinone synthase PqqC [Myxococcota bacterium]